MYQPPGSKWDLVLHGTAHILFVAFKSLYSLNYPKTPLNILIKLYVQYSNCTLQNLTIELSIKIWERFFEHQVGAIALELVNLYVQLNICLIT